jgi:hypothetical protein
VPDNFSAIILGSSSVLPATYQAYVVQSAPTPANASEFSPVTSAPTTLPTPFAMPSFANPNFQASNNPGIVFPTGSTISVYLNNSALACLPTYFLGTFKVQ